MRRLISLFAVLSVPALVFWGCGDDFDAGNRLIVQSVAPTNQDGFSFPAVEKTLDEGRDGDPATIDADGSQGNGFWDGPLETLNDEDRLSDDLVTLTLENRTREGVETGVDLEVYRVLLTYSDGFGQQPAYAPRQDIRFQLDIPAGGTGELILPIATVNMKAVDNGLREIFITQRPAQVSLTVVIDIFARDVLNDIDDVHVQAVQNIAFHNPNVTN